MNKLPYTFFTDSRHGWLQVGLFEANELEILDKISGFSYIDNNYIYLEEDCDASVFLRAKLNLPDNSEYNEEQKASLKQFWLTCGESYSHDSPVRIKAQYSAEGARKKIQKHQELENDNEQNMSCLKLIHTNAPKGSDAYKQHYRNERDRLWSLVGSLNKNEYHLLIMEMEYADFLLRE